MPHSAGDQKPKFKGQFFLKVLVKDVLEASLRTPAGLRPSLSASAASPDLCSYLHTVLSLYMCICVQIPTIIRTPDTLGQEPTLLQDELSLTNCIYNDVFPNNVTTHSDVLGTRTLT